MSFLERVDESIRRSPVWRSLFRNAYPNDERSRAYAVMNNVFLHLHPVRVRQPYYTQKRPEVNSRLRAPPGLRLGICFRFLMYVNELPCRRA